MVGLGEDLQLRIEIDQVKQKQKKVRGGVKRAEKVSRTKFIEIYPYSGVVEKNIFQKIRVAEQFGLRKADT